MNIEMGAADKSTEENKTNSEVHVHRLSDTMRPHRHVMETSGAFTKTKQNIRTQRQGLEHTSTHRGSNGSNCRK